MNDLVFHFDIFTVIGNVIASTPVGHCVKKYMA